MDKKSKRLFLASSFLTFGAVAAFAVAVGGRAAASLYKPARAAAIDPVEDEITRRVYFVNNGSDSFWTSGNLYLHAWQLSDNTRKTESLVQATRLMDDVYHGLWYADVTFAGAGDRIGAIVTTNSDWGLADQTVDVQLPTIWSDSPDVIYLNGDREHGETGKRNASVGSVNVMTNSQMAFFLSNFKTCSDSMLDGYNAYLQIIKDFCPEGKIYDGDTVVTDYAYADYVKNGKSYVGLEKNGSTTIANKLDTMRDLFRESGFSISNFHVPLSFSNDPYTCTNGRSSTRIVYTDVVGNGYKNVYSYLPDVPSNAIGIKFLFTNNGGASVRIDADVGTSSPEMVSHLIRTGEGENWAPYDWFNTSNNRGHYSIAAGISRECTFLFDQSKGKIDGFLMFLDSAYETADKHSGDVEISNAVYLFALPE